jgi:hypothetical protein
VAKKRISSVDLAWLISEELFDPARRDVRASPAVVSDEKDGWPVIIPKRNRRYLTAADEQRLAEIQRKLRLVYEIKS